MALALRLCRPARKSLTDLAGTSFWRTSSGGVARGLSALSSGRIYGAETRWNRPKSANPLPRSPFRPHLALSICPSHGGELWPDAAKRCGRTLWHARQSPLRLHLLPPCPRSHRQPPATLPRRLPREVGAGALDRAAISELAALTLTTTFLLHACRPTPGATRCSFCVVRRLRSGDGTGRGRCW